MNFMQDLDPLTKREYECAVIAANGVSSQQIAVELGIKRTTVDKHLYNVYEKLFIKGRIELAKYFLDDTTHQRIKPKQEVPVFERIKSAFSYLTIEEQATIFPSELAKKAHCSIPSARKFLKSVGGLTGKPLLTVIYKENLISLRELSKLGGLNRQTLYARIFDYGWDVERSVNTPVRYCKPKSSKYF